MRTLQAFPRAAALGFATAASAQYPSKSIRLIIGFPPGVLTDITGRLISSGMLRLGQPIVVIYRRAHGRRRHHPARMNPQLSIGKERGMSTTLQRLLVAAVFAAASWAAAAQYPSRPIRLIVPFPPGGPTDVSARVIANGMTRLGQPVVVENRPGGNNLIAIRAVVDSPPDGYTLGYVASSIALAPATSRSFDVDPVRQLTAISQALQFPLAIAISPKKYPNVKTLAEFVALAKAAAGKFNFALVSANGGDAILVRQLARAGGFDGAYIVYKGGLATTQAVVSGDADATTVSPQTAIAIVQQGSIRLLTITGQKRFRMLPEVPTLAESGYPGVNLTNWFGFVGPARMPADVVATLYSAIAISLKSAFVEKALFESGTDIVGNTPQEFAKLIASELAMYRKLVADGIVPQGE